MLQVDVQPRLLVTRYGGASALVPDRYHHSFVGRRPGYISNPIISKGRVSVTWLSNDGKPGSTEAVAVHRLTPLGGFYEPPPPPVVRTAWHPIDAKGLRLQGSWVFPGERKPVEAKWPRRRRRRTTPPQLELAL